MTVREQMAADWAATIEHDGMAVTVRVDRREFQALLEPVLRTDEVVDEGDVESRASSDLHARAEDLEDVRQATYLEVDGDRYQVTSVVESPDRSHVIARVVKA